MHSAGSIFVFPDRPQTNYYFQGDFSRMLNEVQLTAEASLKFDAVITPVFDALHSSELVTLPSKGDLESSPFAACIEFAKKAPFFELNAEGMAILTQSARVCFKENKQLCEALEHYINLTLTEAFTSVFTDDMDLKPDLKTYLQHFLTNNVVNANSQMASVKYRALPEDFVTHFVENFLDFDRLDLYTKLLFSASMYFSAYSRENLITNGNADEDVKMYLNTLLAQIEQNTKNDFGSRKSLFQNYVNFHCLGMHIMKDIRKNIKWLKEEIYLKDTDFQLLETQGILQLLSKISIWLDELSIGCDMQLRNGVSKKVNDVLKHMLIHIQNKNYKMVDEQKEKIQDLITTSNIAVQHAAESPGKKSVSHFLSNWLNFFGGKENINVSPFSARSISPSKE